MLKWLGFKLTHLSELALLEARVADAEKLAARLERELEYWREVAESERERADRQLDQLLQQNGLPEVTSTGVRERRERAKDAADDYKQQQSQLNEMFAETLNTVHDEEGLELPEELREAAQSMIDEANENLARRKG